MLRLAVIVHLVSGENPRKVFRKMPLRLIYAYEHIFYLREGFKVRRLKESIESILNEI